MTFLRLKTVHIIVPLLLILMALMLAFPTESFAAAERGIVIWWNILFPSLFPFFVIAEMLLGFGIVHFFGTLLDPIMRPVFRIPGIGGFVMAMGFASGYPVPARLTAQLWEQGLIDREEGERLVAVATTSDPIFLIGAVAVGFFNNVGLAVVLAAAHYGTALVIGLIMRFHGHKKMPPVYRSRSSEPLLLRSLRAMHRARLADGRPLGVLMQQGIRTSIQLIFVIGGLVVFFSVLPEAFRITGVMQAWNAIIAAFLQAAHFPSQLAESVAGGVFEVTLGTKSAADTGGGLQYEAAVAAGLLSWGGLSVHAQIVSLLHRTNLRYTPFMIARLLHSILSVIAVLLLWEPLGPLRQSADAAFAVFARTNPAQIGWHLAIPGSMLQFFTVIVLFLLALLLIFCFSRMYERAGK